VNAVWRKCQGHRQKVREKPRNNFVRSTDALNFVKLEIFILKVKFIYIHVV